MLVHDSPHVQQMHQILQPQALEPRHIVPETPYKYGHDQQWLAHLIANIPSHGWAHLHSNQCLCIVLSHELPKHVLFSTPRGVALIL